MRFANLLAHLPAPFLILIGQRETNAMAGEMQGYSSTDTTGCTAASSRD